MGFIRAAVFTLCFFSAGAGALTAAEKAQLNLSIDRAIAKTLLVDYPSWPPKSKAFRLLEMPDRTAQAAILDHMEWSELMMLVRYRAESLAYVASQAVDLDSNRSLALPYAYRKTARAFLLLVPRIRTEPEWMEVAQEASAALRLMHSLTFKRATKKAPLPPPRHDDLIGPALSSIGAAEFNWAMMGIGGVYDDLYPFTFPRHEDVRDPHAEVWIQQAYSRAKLDLDGALLRKGQELGVSRPVYILSQMQNPKGALVAASDVVERLTVCDRLLRFFLRR